MPTAFSKTERARVFPRYDFLTHGAGSDPFAGTSVFSRWQTHVPGSGALLGNLFQDLAMTTPAVADGDPIRVIKGYKATGNLTNVDPKFKLTYENGVPIMADNMSAIGYAMPDQSALTQGEVFILFKNTAAPAFLYVMGNGSDTYIPLDGSSIYDSFGASARHDAIPGTITSGVWNIYNASSANGAWRCALNGTELFSTSTNTVQFLSSPFCFGEAGLNYGGNGIATVVFSQGLTTAQRARILAYYTALKP